MQRIQRRHLEAFSAAMSLAAVFVAAGLIRTASVAADEHGHPQGACVIFFEGNNCSVGFDRSSCCTAASAFMRGCWINDEARSMEVHGPAGTTLTVFDSPKRSTNDDYFVVTKRSAEPVCVGSFENARTTLDGTQNEWFYSGGNGLDGKVSNFAWADPRN